MSRWMRSVCALAWWLCLVLLFGSMSAALAGSLSDELRKPGKAADPAQAPTLRVLDEAGQLRWQVPVVLWTASREELGGYPYPCGVQLNRPLHIRAPLVFAGYGLTTDTWDDYAGQRVDGSIAVIFTGTPRVKPEKETASRDNRDAAEKIVREIQKKVENAKAHGAVAVLLERDPTLPPCQENFLIFPSQVQDLPLAAPAIWFYQVDQLSLPTFSIGGRTLEAIVALSSDLFRPGITTGNIALRGLAEDAVSGGKGLGPVPLYLQAEVSWTGGQLRKATGHHCDIWYQPGTSVGREISRTVDTCDKTIEHLESLLSIHSDKQVSILLFPDWRSKLFCTGTLGWGAQSGSRLTLVYEDKDSGQPTLVHELCHMVAGSQGHHPPAAFDEGLAALAGDTLGDLTAMTSGSLAADRTTAANLRQGQLWTLKELLAIPQSEWGTPQRRNLVSYPEAASFCAFLMRRIGFDGFRKLYQTLKPDDQQQIANEMEKATGRTLDQFETDWHAYLRGTGR